MGYSYVFNNLKRDIYTTSYNLSELAIILVTSAFAEQSDTFRIYDTMSDLIASSATLFIGGDINTSYQDVTVAPNVISDGYNGWIVPATSDVVWINSNFTNVAGALIYDPSNFTDTDLNKLVCYIDFGGLKSAVNGSFTVPLTRGILQTP